MPAIIDVHVHYRSDAQLAQALRQAERLDMVLCVNTINLEGTVSPHVPSAAFVTACNDRTAGGGAGASAAHHSLLVPQSGARRSGLRGVAATDGAAPGSPGRQTLDGAKGERSTRRCRA